MVQAKRVPAENEKCAFLAQLSIIVATNDGRSSAVGGLCLPCAYIGI